MNTKKIKELQTSVINSISGLLGEMEKSFLPSLENEDAEQRTWKTLKLTNQGNLIIKETTLLQVHLKVKSVISAQTIYPSAFKRSRCAILSFEVTLAKPVSE